jgi:hypothetical protein
MGSRGSFPAVRQPGRKADHPPPSSAEFKNAWSYTSTPQYAFMAWCSVEAQGQLYLTFTYGRETWSLTLKEEYRLRVFENRTLRRICGPKRKEGRLEKNEE